MSDSQAALLLTEVGFHCLDPEGTARESWITVLDEEAIFADHDPARDRLVLRADVGFPPPERREATFDLLLQFSDHADRTGQRMAWDEETATVVLIVDLALSRLDADTLQTVLVNLVERRVAWRRIVEEGVEEGAAALPASGLPAGGAAAGIIQV